MENVYQKYHVKKVINASGKMTILGGSRVTAQVVEAMSSGASSFFEVKDLLDKTGNYLASKLKVESAYIVNSASGGIAQSVAASINQGNLRDVLDIFNPTITKREIILCKGHNVDYGTTIELPIQLGGGRVVEVGYANTCLIEHIEAKINQNTAALLYVKSHHCVQKGMPTIEDFVSLSKKYKIPVIVDAAAEEDLKKYYEYGVDVVIYSGTKAFEGPTSGLLVGKKKFIDLVKMQSKGIGRVLKVGKENILGLTFAIEQYLNRVPLSMEKQRQRLETFNATLNTVSGISAKCVQDGAGRSIIRSQISFDESIIKKTTKEISQLLKDGDIAIYTRDYLANVGKIEIDIRDVSDEELVVILNTITTIIKGEIHE